MREERKDRKEDGSEVGEKVRAPLLGGCKFGVTAFAYGVLVPCHSRP